MRLALIQAEFDVEKKLSAEKPGVQSGIWIEQMTTLGTGGSGPNTQANMTPGAMNNSTPGTIQSGNTILLVCRAVSLQNVDASANSDMAYAVENELQASKYFDPKTTALAGNISPDDPDGTFTFGINVTLSTPPQF
jgi:hypothetical protein